MHFNNLLLAAMSVCAVSCADNMEIPNGFSQKTTTRTDGEVHFILSIGHLISGMPRGVLSMIFPMPVIMED